MNIKSIDEIKDIVAGVFEKRTDSIKLIKDKNGDEFIEVKLNKQHYILTKQEAIGMQKDFINIFKK